jgi:hypothetical protein
MSNERETAAYLAQGSVQCTVVALQRRCVVALHLQLHAGAVRRYG